MDGPKVSTEEPLVVIQDDDNDEVIYVSSSDDDVIYVLPESTLERNILEIPKEILRRVLLEVVAGDGDVAFNRLALTCKDFRDVVSEETFRNEAHFAWLDSVVNWSQKSPEFKAKYRVPYALQNCAFCNDIYKEMPPGYFGNGKRGVVSGFYCTIDFSGYCSHHCFSIDGNNYSPRD